MREQTVVAHADAQDGDDEHQKEQTEVHGAHADAHRDRNREGEGDERQNRDRDRMEELRASEFALLHGDCGLRGVRGRFESHGGAR